MSAYLCAVQAARPDDGQRAFDRCHGNASCHCLRLLHQNDERIDKCGAVNWGPRKGQRKDACDGIGRIAVRNVGSDAHELTHSLRSFAGGEATR